MHDIEVTNGDECVTVKSPSDAFTIESIHCNLSGGTAIGSLGTGTSVTNIKYVNLYMNVADACYIKTNNGDGVVDNIEWTNVIVHGGAYVLTVNEAWGGDRGSTGVQISNLRFKVSNDLSTFRTSPCGVGVDLNNHSIDLDITELARI
jgi:rhamnogalacturonan hydrolase